MQDQKMIPASMWGGHVNLLKYGAKERVTMCENSCPNSKDT